MNENLRLCAIPSLNAMYVWDVVEDMILAALMHADGKYTIQDIFMAIKDKEMQLWVVVDQDDMIHAVVVTQIIYYPSKKVMLFVIVSGVKFDNWSHFLPHFKLFAKDHDCSALEFYGREGWEKKVASLGFKKIHTVLRLNINGE